MRNKFTHPKKANVALMLQTAVQHQQAGDLQKAEVLYRQVLQLEPNQSDAWHLLGVIYSERRQHEQSLEFIDKAIAIRPNVASFYYNRGNSLKKLKRLEEAIASYDQAISLNPNYAEAFNNQGASLHELARFDEALTSYDRAIALKSDFAVAFNNRGNTLKELKRLDEALSSYDQAISLKSSYAEAFSNRGNALRGLKRLDEALSSYDRAIALNSDYVKAYFHKSLVLLSTGNFKQGWPLYEWRLKRAEPSITLRRFTQPLWLGEQDIKGKTVLLHPEQGLGDTIQFCRYAQLVKARGATVILEAPPPLMHVLNTLSGVDMLVEADGTEPPIHYDFHCPLMSLPLAFKTDVHSIPHPEAYLFAAPDKTNAWKHKLGEHSKLRVGVVWNGGFRPNQPEIWAVNERRNIALDIFAAGLNEVDACFYSLQKGDPAESEIRGKESQYWPRGNFINYADEIVDFSDTAALIKNMDLVISVDTSTAHLAAALGTPTWVLNRFDSCWRWLQDRDDSPWYASIKLYRQEADMQWQPVLQRMARDLIKKIEKRDLTRTPSPYIAD